MILTMAIKIPMMMIVIMIIVMIVVIIIAMMIVRFENSNNDHSDVCIHMYIHKDMYICTACALDTVEFRKVEPQGPSNCKSLERQEASQILQCVLMECSSCIYLREN